MVSLTDALPRRGVGKFAKKFANYWESQNPSIPLHSAPRGDIALALFAWLRPEKKLNLAGEGFTTAPSRSSFRYSFASGSLPKHVLRNRIGNQVTFAALYCALGRRFGINAYPIKLSTGKTKSGGQRHIIAAAVEAGGRPVVFDLAAGKANVRRPFSKISDSELLAYAFTNHGLDMFFSGLPKPAMKFYNKAVRAFPGTEEPWLNRGFLFSLLGRHDEAMENYNRAVKLNPGSHSLLHERGLAFLAKGMPDEAIADYKRAAGLNPANPAYWQSMANALIALGKKKEALAVAKEAQGKNPKRAWPWRLQGHVYKRMGKPNSAAYARTRARFFGRGAF